jgi:hypothetical protein
MNRTEEFLDKVAQKSFPNMTKERQRGFLDMIALRLAQSDLMIVSRAEYEKLLAYKERDSLKDLVGPLY